MTFEPVYLSDPKHTEDEDDLWALQVYNTVRDPQEDIIIKEKEVDVLHSCFTPARQSFPVIVREEYRLIWQSTQNAFSKPLSSRHGGLVVYGQPGIGKSLFLRYALAHAIKAQIPVAWCVASTFFYFFDISGVSRWDYTRPPPNCKLALFDTVPEMESPMPSFYGPNNGIFVIQATSPETSRWKEWSKQTNAELWIMDVWNATEIDYMRKLKPTKEKYYDPAAVSIYLGPSARYCAWDWKNCGDPIVDFAGWGPPLPKDSDCLYDELKQCRSNDVDFFHFIFVTPCPTDKRPANAFLDPHISNKELQELCRKFSRFPQIYGAMYEVFAIKKRWVLREDATCHFLNGAPFVLPGDLTSTCDILSDDAPANTFWVAPSGYPTIDAVAVTSREGKKCFTFLQMTIAKTHGINREGIRKIWLNFEKVRDTEWRFVFIVPSEDIGKRLWREPHPVHPRRKKAPVSPNVQTLKRKCLPPPTSIDVPVGYMVVDSMTKEQREQWAKAFLWGKEEIDDNAEYEYEYVEDEQIDNVEA